MSHSEDRPTRGLSHAPADERAEGPEEGPKIESADARRCRMLEARVAQLEAELAEARGAIEKENEQNNDARDASMMGPSGQEPPRPGAALPPLQIKALRLVPYGWGEGWGLRPAPARRNWMDQNDRAYQCLPMVVANQWGWQVLCPTDVRAVWDGSPGAEGVRVEVAPQYEPAIKSQFGGGIVTFSPPWLFRTPPGWDLHVKGPANRWKPNCTPLEGIVETWWLNYTFTINWKIVEPGAVAFARGESLAQLVPAPHAAFQGAEALEAPIGLLEPDAARELLEWLERRRSIAGQKANVHHLYRKAEGIDDHLQRVGVPPFRSIIP